MTADATNGPVEIVIPDALMDKLKDAPAHVVDGLADVIAQMREHGPDAVADARAMVPHPVDHSPGRTDVYVPSTRSVSCLRNAVADISPPTVSVFDQELAEDTNGGPMERRVVALRGFVLRWIEYIGLQGDHATARRLEASTSADEFGQRFTQAMRDIHARNFPDARDDPQDLAIRLVAYGRQWLAVCPITMLRVYRPTQQDAYSAIMAALAGLLTGM